MGKDEIETVDCPECEGTGEGEKDHPDCPDCSCWSDCPKCDGTGEVPKPKPGDEDAQDHALRNAELEAVRTYVPPEKR